MVLGLQCCDSVLGFEVLGLGIYGYFPPETRSTLYIGTCGILYIKVMLDLFISSRGGIETAMGRCVYLRGSC